ncbi:MAG: 50S ribosomal protein L9 [Chloroflexi bacterium]|nr:50S ribosomal protein L9 [Chloroflexota bacterium]
MQVILQRDVPDLGQAGEVKNVAPGYFRNFLMPRGLAIEASKGQMRALKVRSSSRTAQEDRARDHTSALARQLEELTLTIPVRLGEQGRLYGSVTNKDIAEALEAQGRHTIDRHKIELREPLKSLGVHTVPLKLEHGVEASLRVELVPAASAEV